MEKASLLRRILPPLAGAVAVLTLLVLMVGVSYMREAVLDRARERAVTLSSLEGERFESVLDSGEHRDLQRRVERFRAHPDIAAVRILASDGTVHASTQSSEMGQPAGAHGHQQGRKGDTMTGDLSGASDRPLVVHTVQPFLNRQTCQPCHDPGARVIGFLDLDVAVNPHLVGLTAFTGFSALLGLLYLVAVVGVTGPLIAVVVGRPMRRLVESMAQVRAGNLDVQVEASGTREIDDVADGFNQMVARLRRGRAAEEDARRLELERAQQLASVGELAAGLAHEIRNPLSGVKAVVDVVTRDTSDEARRAVLRDASHELTRIDQIVRELLQYARPKKPVAGAFELNPLVIDTLALTFPGSSTVATRVTTTLDGSLPRVFADAAQVRQVLVNLLLNADQAAGPDGTVTIATGRGEDRVWCRVHDSGGGIPAERAETIFRPFVTSKPRGTGLGLSISRRIIELQGGTLVLDNPGEAGASFTFTLPVSPD